MTTSTQTGGSSSPTRKRLCIVAYEGITNPATRLRALQYIPDLEACGYDVETYFVPFPKGERAAHLRALWSSIVRADVVFVQRVLRGWLNAMLAYARTPVVFDVDDALHYIRQSQYAAAATPTTLRHRATNLYRRIVRGDRFHSSRHKPLGRMLQLAATVIAGNNVLRQEFSGRTRKVVVLPTAVPVESYPVREHGPANPVRIGWIGVASNVFHLDLLDGAFRALHERFGDRVRLVVVSNRSFDRAAIATEFILWSLETESAETARFDIGIMPLQDDFFSRGKCSFKAIYCMAHGVPVVISPVGMNAELVESGRNGFLADTVEEWTDALGRLVEDVELRRRLGAEARASIERAYGTRTVFAGLLAVLDELSGLERPVSPSQSYLSHA
jgi:glycosyltransferase involved in cell wall biosynthesis